MKELHIPEAFLRDVRRAVSVLVESAPRLTECGLVSIIEQLVSFVGRTGMLSCSLGHYETSLGWAGPQLLRP